VFIGSAIRTIMLHLLDISVGRNLPGQKFHDLFGAGQTVRHNQMAHQQIAADNDLRVHQQVSHRPGISFKTWRATSGLSGALLSGAVAA
jgi:hypothetical protein